MAAVLAVIHVEYLTIEHNRGGFLFFSYELITHVKISYIEIKNTANMFRLTLYNMYIVYSVMNVIIL